MWEFINRYELPNLPQELQLLLLEFSGHVRRGSRSVTYVLYL